MTEDYLAKESNKVLLGRFVTCVGADYKEDYSPALWPDWSEDTVALWTEIESRMSRPYALNFDRESCLIKISEEIKKQKELASPPDYTTSYHIGIASGLNLAYRIIEENIHKETDNENRTGNS